MNAGGTVPVDHQREVVDHSFVLLVAHRSTVETATCCTLKRSASLDSITNAIPNLIISAPTYGHNVANHHVIHTPCSICIVATMFRDIHSVDVIPANKIFALFICRHTYRVNDVFHNEKHIR